MKKCISVLCVMILVLLCSACEQTFTVEMSGTDPDDTVSVEIILPDGGKEQDVTFIIDGAVCEVESFPTVRSPEYVFARGNYAWLSMRLVLADSVEGMAELRRMTAEGEKQVYRAFMREFEPLLEYLGHN